MQQPDSSDTVPNNATVLSPKNCQVIASQNTIIFETRYTA